MQQIYHHFFEHAVTILISNCNHENFFGDGYKSAIWSEVTIKPFLRVICCHICVISLWHFNNEALSRHGNLDQKTSHEWASNIYSTFDMPSILQTDVKPSALDANFVCLSAFLCSSLDTASFLKQLLRRDVLGIQRHFVRQIWTAYLRLHRSVYRQIVPHRL